MITFRCKHCDAEHKAKPEYAGKRTRCPKCGEILLIPATRQPLSKDDIGDLVTPNATTQPSIPVTCSCGMRLKAKAEHAGRNVKCPKCGESVAVPRASNSLAAESRASLEDWLDQEVANWIPPPEPRDSRASRGDWLDQELSRTDPSPNISSATAMTTVPDNTKTAPPPLADTRNMCPSCGSKNVQEASELERTRFAQAHSKSSGRTLTTCNAC